MDRDGEYPVEALFWVDREEKGIVAQSSLKPKEWRILHHITYKYADGTTEQWNNDGTPMQGT